MAELTKAQILTAGDIGSLSTSLLNKSFVHSLPTQLLLRAHNRVELEHLLNPRDKRLQIAHTNLFLEMELRDLEHFDTDPSFFTPSHTNWPFDFEPDEIERDDRFRRKIMIPLSKRKRPQGRFPKKPKRQRLGRRKPFKDIISQPNEKADISLNKTHKVFRDQAVKTWNIQPDSGNIPIANGPRPKKEHWYNIFIPPSWWREGQTRAIMLGTYQAFMQKTLSAFYRRQTPPWAIQEWDIQLTITNADGTDTIEKRNFIQAFIDPN
jgi:hypothetical protein